jgi:hypothetical protein
MPAPKIQYAKISIVLPQLVSQGEALELSGSNHMSTFLRAELILPHVMRFLA